jgi:hypothetical protein
LFWLLVDLDVQPKLPRGFFHALHRGIVGLHRLVVAEREFNLHAQTEPFRVHTGSGTDETTEDIRPAFEGD